MTDLAVRIAELGDDDLEEFVELWLARVLVDCHSIRRMAGPGDKGRDVTAYLESSLHEGEWHLYQCKRKTRGSRLGRGEALGELGKVFHHHVEGAYATLPTRYVFVAPRGIAGRLRDLLLNPSQVGPTLIAEWDKYCARAIAASPVPLTGTIRALIAGFDFSRVTFLIASDFAKDPHARAALVEVLGSAPGHAPMGTAPAAIQPEELRYLDQLRRVYEDASGEAFATPDDVLAHADHGEHLRDQRTRFFEAQAFDRFHRDNTPGGALLACRRDVYHAVMDVHRQPRARHLDRVDAVMIQASQAYVGILATAVRAPVKQGMCHHLANEGTLPWIP